MNRNMKDRQHGESQTSEENVVALDQLPFDLTTELGAVAAAEEISPGVYRISTNKTETRCAYSEYYVVTQNAQAISDKARAYGKVFTEKPGLYVYDLGVPESGWYIVSFEILRHQKKHHLPVLEQQDSMYAAAIYGMEEHPEYFGKFPVPAVTPRGYTVRHKEISNGVYWLETDCCEEMLAVCYPIWQADITIPEQNIGEQLEYDRMLGINHTLGYLFYSKRNSCIPLFELTLVNQNVRESNAFDKAALLNVLCKFYPEYVRLHNEDETRCGQSRFITENPDAGLEFIEF